MRKELLVCGLLLLAVVAVFGQTLRHDFVNYDDEKYVSKNPHVVQGLNAESVAWAFTSRHASNWHPLTWLSHLLDCQIYGQAVWGHHLSSVLLHAAAAVVLFLVLRQMTGELWPSAFTAAIFAIHPLRAESVAWVAERKDVLSGLFFMLTIAAYLSYVRRPLSLWRYLLVAVMFALGLMAKPMLVTLPLVLLLLDYWPLRRFPPWRRLIVEKLPLLAMSAASCVMTLWAQREAIAASEPISLPMRLGNAAVSYVAYLVQFFVPVNLAVLYPHPGEHLPPWKIVAAVIAILAITVGVVVWRRRAPYLLAGWLWHVGMLLPVIGLIQVGNQAMADRYTYLPQIGLCMALAWAAASVVGYRAWRHRVCGIAAAAALTLLMACAWQQTSYWLNSETLWTHTLACTESNHLAHYNLGVALAALERSDEAIAQYAKAVEIRPDYAEARYNMAVLFGHGGRYDEAIEQYLKVVAITPNFSDAHCNLGVALARRARDAEAMEHYRRALEITPEFAEAHNNLGNALVRCGRIDEAIFHYRRALEIMPDYAAARNNLEMALVARTRP